MNFKRIRLQRDVGVIFRETERREILTGFSAQFFFLHTPTYICEQAPRQTDDRTIEKLSVITIGAKHHPIRARLLSEEAECLSKSALQTAQFERRESLPVTGWLFASLAPSIVPKLTYCGDKLQRDDSLVFLRS